MIHEIFPVGPLQCNCSVFGDEVSREAIVVDPGGNTTEIVGVFARHRLTPKAIVITHAHIDHIGGAFQLRALTGAPVYMHEADAELGSRLDLQAEWLGMATPPNPGIDIPAREGDTLHLGAAFFHILHTPGHTEGSISLHLPSHSKLIAGDTLFRESIGRTDLPGGNLRRILASIRSKLLTLPDDTVVIPGHGANTTIGRERRTNPFLRSDIQSI